MSIAVIRPVGPDQLRAELGPATRLTGFHDLEVHLFDGPDCPAVLQEIGRIRELSYRAVGAGRNLPLDLDHHDQEEPRYTQIVAFDREHGELVAMYRAIHCGHLLESWNADPGTLRTAGLFHFSPDFVREDLPFLVELGRSVVHRDAHRAIQGLFSVWSGLGALTHHWPDIQGFFGNVTVYPTMPRPALKTLWTYLERHHLEQSDRVRARDSGPRRDLAAMPDDAVDPRCVESLHGLMECAARDGWEVPPILVSYLKACPGLRVFDIAYDEDFGGALEIAIHVPLDGVTDKTRRRFIDVR